MALSPIVSGMESLTADKVQLLMVDDDARLCQLVRDYLNPHGFEVSFVHTGPDGLAKALQDRWDVVVLDVLLPGMDGLEVLRRLRAASEVPVLMLTGLGEEMDRIVGLEIGADDYLPKTFSTRELLARLRAVLRRKTSTEKTAERIEPPLQIGDLVVDPGGRSARVREQTLDLTPVEFDVLLSLARACGRVRSREQLMNDASSREFDSFDRSVDVHISSLRKKLGDDLKNPRFIQTVRAAGYMMPRPGHGEPS